MEKGERRIKGFVGRGKKSMEFQVRITRHFSVHPLHREYNVRIYSREDVNFLSSYRFVYQTHTGLN